MNRNIIVIYLFCYFSLGILQAQPTLQDVQQWNTHLPYNTAISVANAKASVFYATELALYEVFKEDQSIRYHNKVTGLSDVGVSIIDYNTTYEVLIVAYTNGNIDLLNPFGQVANLPAIKQNDNVGANKQINHIYSDSNQVYLSCDFGLVVLDLELGEFTQTTFTSDLAVNSCTKLGDELFIATPEGIYKGNINLNLLDFSNWSLQGSAEGLGTNFYNAETCITVQDKVYGDINDTVMVYDNGTWQHVSFTDNDGVQKDTFFVDKQFGLFRTDPAKERLFIVPGKNYFQDFIMTFTPASGSFFIDGFFNYTITDVAVDEDNTYWVADLSTGATRAAYDGRTVLSPNGPKSQLITDMAISNDSELWCVGSLFDGINAQFDKRGAYRYKEGVWNDYNETTVDALGNIEFWDNVRVIVDDAKDRVYIGSFMHGMLQIDENDSLIQYTSSTPEATLDLAVGDINTRVLGFALDEDGNLWIANHAADLPLSVLRVDGTWKQFDVPASYSGEVSDIVIDRNGYKWIRQTSGNIMVFDEGDMDVSGDEEYIQITTTNNLPSSTVNTLVADRNGIVWAGTDDGVAIFSSCGQDIFQFACTGERPVINPDDFNGRLLEAENVKTIAVDGANRKWIGTDNGVFLLNEDYEQIYFFNEENSPLLDDRVNKIVVDPNTGVVYIATESGLISFRGEATEGRLLASKERVYAFPNPVRPEYTGPITITGLVENVNVKITDISGRLVYEDQALGGQMVWDGADYNGRRVSSGIYMVFTVNDTGKQRLVTKVAILN
ncbi:MAG: regulator [Saprospiraceae bacterium]|nr:regulator [Saprospiraceae bacterium]